MFAQRATSTVQLVVQLLVLILVVAFLGVIGVVVSAAEIDVADALRLPVMLTLAAAAVVIVLVGTTAIMRILDVAERGEAYALPRGTSERRSP